MSISENSQPPSNELSNKLSGTVTKVTPTSIHVAIDNDRDNLADDLTDSDTYKLVKLCNDITHKRLKTALTRLQQTTTHLSDILFHQSEPSQNNFSDTLTFFNHHLDSSQVSAIEFSFRQKELAIIHGPPGTGKTTTLIEIIKQLCLKYKQRVLCCAPSNIAVDNLVERLVEPEANFGRVKMLRLGHPARLLEHLQDYSLDSVLSRCDQRQLVGDIKTEMDASLKRLKKAHNKGERESVRRELRELRKELYQREEKAIKGVMESAECVLATLTSGHGDGPLKHLQADFFDVIIIDECSQAMEAACWIPLVKGARKVILAGDHLQLPPTIVSKEAAAKGLDLTLMKRLIDAYGERCTRMLTMQYRMNVSIMRWISDRLYESRLEAHESVAAHLLTDLPGVARNEDTEASIVLIDTEGCDMAEMVSDDAMGDEESKANEGEANLVCAHAHRLVKSGLRADQIAVITPYNLQVEVIRAKLASKYGAIEVKSVDGFQGREKEAVILSLVRSNTRGEVGFLADQRRINVAITRARRHLCVVCDTQTCKNDAFLKSFIEYCGENADVRSAFDYQAENEDENEFEAIGVGKLKLRDAGVKKGQAKSGDKRKGKVQVAKGGEKKIESISQPTDEDLKFKEEVERIVERLGDEEHVFSSELNARQRRIVHEVAEKMKLNHVSRGEDAQRCITISRKPIKSVEVSVPKKSEIVEEVVEEAVEEGEKVGESLGLNKFASLEVNEEAKVSKKNKKKKSQAKPVDDAKSVLIGAVDARNDVDEYEMKYRADCVTCKFCSKFILKSNYQMHEMHCSKINRVQEATKIEAAKKEEPKEKPKIKVKKSALEGASNDFDELIEACQKMNNICNYEKCKVQIHVLGQTCKFCNHRFCLTHSLAEVHGCGDKAKQEARAHIRTTGNLNVNAPSRPTSSVQKIRQEYAEKKMKEKLTQMQDERRAKKKDDKK